MGERERRKEGVGREGRERLSVPLIRLHRVNPKHFKDVD